MQLALKIIKILGWALIPTAMVVVGIIAQNNYYNSPVNEVKVEINYREKGDLNRFLSYDDISSFINRNYDSIKGSPIKDIDLENLQNSLEELPYIKAANAFATLDGKINLQIQQRRAIIRIIDVDDNNYYLDDMGRIIPIRTKYPARVPVCNGLIPNIGFYINNYSDKELDSIVNNTILEDIYKMAIYIDQDTLLNMQITQLNINNDGEYILTPLVSSQIIEFGKPKNIDAKFKKLKLFYTKGLGHHKWSIYRKISLKYKNQIVCTKY